MIKKLLFFILICPLFLYAQKQPRVGLVLSGGGAKGFAHVGVLEELEKAGVQIDYIGGTSMGAIVGGLYASGYKANEIKKILKSLDFNALIQDEIPRRQKPYFEKKHLEKHAVVLPISKGKIGLPLGLSKGQNIQNLLTELLASVDEITDFSKLPIPFYCIGTDIETGKEVILNKGSLPLAIRASASFPSLLNPVEVDGKLLVDGGVVNNFPVDIMQTKKVDIIIGVNVEGKLYERKSLTSIASILSQIINFQMYRKSGEQVQKVDVYMRPRVAEYNVISFEKIDEIIDAGYRATKPYRIVFDSIAKLQKVKKIIPQKKLNNLSKFKVDRIIIGGNNSYTNKYILNKLQLKKSDTVSYQLISNKINTLAATKNFKRIDYEFGDFFSGKKLTLRLKEEEKKSFLRVGMHYDLLYKTGVLLNYNHKKILTRNDEFSLDLIIGDKIRYNLDYILDQGIFGYGFSTRYNSFSSDFLAPSFIRKSGINKVSVTYRDFTTRFYAQTTLDKKFAFGFGLEHKNLEIFSDTYLTLGNETFFDDSNYINGIAYLSLDTFNKNQFPTEGVFVDVGFKWYLWSDRSYRVQNFASGSNKFSQFSQLDARVSYVASLWKDFTFQFTSEAGYTLGEEATNVFDYRLGSYNQNFINNFFPMLGYDVAELTEQSFLRTSFNFRYRFYPKNYFTFTTNYARLAENVFENIDLFKEVKQGYALGYGLETLLGPIQLQYSWSPDHKKKYWLFNLGFWF